MANLAPSPSPGIGSAKLVVPRDLERIMIGASPAMQEVLAIIHKVAPTNSTVLITGESGVGKELAAWMIHQESRRYDKPFLPVNCGAIPGELLESHLFGHTRGAFTGAVAHQEGLFQRAEGGTILLDEIGDVPFHLQVKLLRAIQQKEILPVGTSTPVRIDVRILAATNRDLRQRVQEGQFREDLFYRLNVVNIEIPPLRRRREDIPDLIEKFVRRHNGELERSYKGVENGTIMLLMALPWTGNVRELENALESAMILGDGDWITVADLPRSVRGESSDAPEAEDDLRAALRAYAKTHIKNVLRGTGNDKRKAAERLGLGLSSLYRKIDDLEIASGYGGARPRAPSRS
jgi:transcriptional regulator with PAS, ATPase and Fis domain